MRKIKNELDELVYEEYGDKLDAKDQEIENKEKTIKSQAKTIKTKNNEIINLNKSNHNYRKLIKKLNKFDDLNTPEARKILDSLTLL